jgi:hypothetical protein
LEIEISLVPASFPFTKVRYRNRPILSCSAFAREPIEVKCPIEDPVMDRANNATDKKAYRISNHVVVGVAHLATAKFRSERMWVRIPNGGPRNNGTSAIG